MLAAIASLYHNVQFSVKFADGLSPSFTGDTGVRQGCPLSPFLFGVFIEMLHDNIIAARPEGLGPFLKSPQGQHVHIPILMFADDIVLIGLNAVQLQQLLEVLGAFCVEHDMLVSDDKTQSVIFHKSFAKRADKQFHHTVGQLPVRAANEYKYLGMIFGSKGQTSKLLSDAAIRGTKAKGVLYRMYNKLGISSNVYLKLRLFKAIMLPNLTYGCEVWGQQLLQLEPSNPFDNPVDKVTTAFLRNLMGVKSSTSNWCLYREVGMYPLQLFCFRQMLRFVNKLKILPELTWARMVLCELAEEARNPDSHNWFSDLLQFARKIGAHVSWPVLGNSQHDLPVFCERTCIAALRSYYSNLFTDQATPSRMQKYQRLFAKKVRAEGNKWYGADYTYMPLTARKTNMLARCRLASHHLKVETGAWQRPILPYELRTCDLCEMGVVQSEHHMLFHCTHFSESRARYLAAHMEAIGGTSVWCLFNDPAAQSDIAEFLQSTGLMVR
jgi:hypothetical protein